MSNKYLIAAAVVAFTSVPVLAQVPGGDMRDAMFQALNSSSGSFRGELTGVTGDEIRKITKSTGPVLADISTVRVFKNPECKRLKANITAPQAVFKDVKTGLQQVFGYTFYMNLCPDGSPPDDGLSGIGPNEGQPIMKTKP